VRPDHVVLVTIDTLRADRLGCYGSKDVETPNIDRIAREGAIAPEASVHVPLTRPSHVSILTGLYPAQHGVRDNISLGLAPNIPTLAEAFQHAGYRTAGFVSSIVLSAQSGLARGFDDYSDRFEAGADDARFLDTLQKRGDVTTAEAIAWLDAHAANRTFTWLHLYDPHDPYEPPEPYASRYAGRPYDGEVAWTDELVGRLDAALERLHIRERTLVVLTSDHGEGLSEHEEPVHGFFVYETTLRVPLVVRGPGVAAGAKVPVVFRSIDLFPTVLDLAGVAAPQTGPPRPGRTLAASLRGNSGKVDEQPAFAESLTPKIHYGWSDLRSIRDGRWKYILAPRPELYDLAADPGERTNLAETSAARARALRRGLEQHLAETETAATSASTNERIPSDLVEKLGALGYVSGSPTPDSGSAGADPKDKIGEYRILNRLLREGLVALREEDYAASAERFRALAARGIDSFESHYYYGRALAGLHRWREAATEFERAIPRLPAFAGSYLQLADCRKVSGDLKGAIAVLHLAETAVPPNAAIDRRLGELHRDAGDLARAEEYFRKAIARDPSDASQWNSVGMIVGARGDLAEAERMFREAIARDSREPRYTFNLGLTLEREHRRDEAASYYKATLELDPRFTAARERLTEIRK
jgi:arylsulfatase A-like enzyme